MTRQPHAEAMRRRCLAFLHRALPAEAPAKRLAEILDQSRQTAARLIAGEAPTAAQLMALAQHFGQAFVAEVFEPVVGEMTNGATMATLARVETLLDAVRRSSGVASAAGTGAGTGTARTAASGDEFRTTSTRLELSEIARYPALVPALERFRDRGGRLELGEAMALARADSDGRTSVNRRSERDVLRFAYRARASRLHTLDEPLHDRPVTSMADADYGALIMRFADETRQSADPVLARFRGPVRRSDGMMIFTNVVVLRTMDRARDGTEIFSSQYVMG